MAKRFVDSDLWEKSWFMDLPVNEKLAYLWLKSNCDCVGVWSPNFKLANFVIGAEIDWNTLLDKTNGNIEVLPDGKWWLVDFCHFQYGELSEASPPHRKYISMLKKHCLYERVTKGYVKGNETLQEEEEEKEEEKEKEIAKGISRFNDIWSKYPNKLGRKEALKHFKATVKTDKDFTDIQTALANYIQTDTVKNGFIKHGSTWFNNWRDYVNYKDPNIKQNQPLGAGGREL